MLLHALLKFTPSKSSMLRLEKTAPAREVPEVFPVEVRYHVYM
jgi:hypothetical protein